MSDPATPRVRKHLMTPGQAPRAGPPGRGMSLGSVQRWVMSALAVTTVLHLSAGLVLAAAYVDERSSQIGLLVISGGFGLVALASGLLIHRRSPLHPALLLGLVPPLVGAWWIFG